MKAPYFVDTNIFLRFLTGDLEAQAQACYGLFKQARRGAITLTTSEAVLTEVVYVLAKHYQVARGEIRRKLKALLSLKSFQLPHRSTYFKALDIYRQHPIDFEDCLTVAHMARQGNPGLYSYDHDFDRFDQINRLEPEPIVLDEGRD